MDTATHHDGPSGGSVEMGTLRSGQIQSRPGDPWSFPEFGAKVTGQQQVSLERLKIETMRRRGLEELFGMIRYHTSRQVKGYKGKEMDDFVRDISLAVDFLVEQGIHFYPPAESDGRDGWVRFVKSLEAISPQVYAGTYVFENDHRLSPGALYAQEPYRQAWTFEEMMEQRAFRFDLKHATYMTDWQSFCNAFRRVDQQLTEDQPEAYVRALDRHVVPELAPALAQIFSMHSERVMRGMKNVRRQVDDVMQKDHLTGKVLSDRQVATLEFLRAVQFHDLIERIDRLHSGYDRLRPMIQIVSQVVGAAMDVLNLEMETPGKYRLQTDVVANHLRQMYSIDKMMTRV